VPLNVNQLPLTRTLTRKRSGVIVWGIDPPCASARAVIADAKNCNPFAIRFLIFHRSPSLLVPSGAL
jgi:hypothetical protein